MNYPIVPQPKRNLQAYSTESFPEGLYIDNNTGEVFASNRSLAKLIGVSPSTIHGFIESEGDRRNAAEMAEVQTARGVQRVRLHPELTIEEAIEKYRPSLLKPVKRAGIRVFLHGLAGFATISTAVAHPALTPLEQALQDKIKLLEDLQAAERRAAESEKRAATFQEESRAKEIFFLRAVKDRPGFEDMANGFQKPHEQLCLPVSGNTQADWTLHEWMVDSCSVVLEGTLFNRFKSKVHGAYKAIYHKNPKVGYRARKNNPNRTQKLQVYVPDEFPILRQCYVTTLLEKRK